MFATIGQASSQSRGESPPECEVATEDCNTDGKVTNGGTSSASGEFDDENIGYVALTGQDFSSMLTGSFCVVQASDGKMFRLEKEVMRQRSVDCEAIFGVDADEDDLRGPYVLDGFASDVLEAAFNFMRGHSWGTIDLSTVLGLWSFGHMFGLRGIVANARVDAGLQAHTSDARALVEIARTARNVSAPDVSNEMHKMYVARRWGRSCDFSFAGKELVGFDEFDAERIGRLVIAEEGEDRVTCDEPGFRFNLSHLCRRSFEGMTSTTEKCTFPARSVELLRAVLAWSGQVDGEEEDRLRTAKRLCHSINCENVMERDILPLFEKIEGTSLEIMNLVAYYRLEAHKQDLSKKEFLRCRSHW